MEHEAEESGFPAAAIAPSPEGCVAAARGPHLTHTHQTSRTTLFSFSFLCSGYSVRNGPITGKKRERRGSNGKWHDDKIWQQSEVGLDWVGLCLRRPPSSREHRTTKGLTPSPPRKSSKKDGLTRSLNGNHPLSVATWYMPNLSSDLCCITSTHKKNFRAGGETWNHSSSACVGVFFSLFCSVLSNYFGGLVDLNPCLQVCHEVVHTTTVQTAPPNSSFPPLNPPPPKSRFSSDKRGLALSLGGHQIGLRSPVAPWFSLLRCPSQAREETRTRKFFLHNNIFKKIHLVR